MRVLILGGTGLIGAAVIRELIKHRHKVLALSRSTRSMAMLKALGASPLRGDLRAPDAWVQSVRRVDAIIQVAATFTEDGWLKTGDVGLLDEEGFLKLVDRKKDMIIVSGFNVFPNEVEDVVSSHPKVRECAAVGVPDAKSGEAVKVYVIPADDSVTENELKEFCRERLTAYKVPKHFEFRDELPKSNVGKILRRELRDEAAKS